MHISRISVAKYPIRIRSIKEITIRILSVSVRIADIGKISIRGYISAHLWPVRNSKQYRKYEIVRRYNNYLQLDLMSWCDLRLV